MSDKYYLFNIKPVMEPGLFGIRGAASPIERPAYLKPAPVAGFIFSVFLSPFFLKMLFVLICWVYLSDKYSLLWAIT